MAPYDPLEQNLDVKLLQPSLNHVLGTDHMGRDILSRTLWGARLSLIVGILVIGSAVCIGMPLGLVSGYFGGAIDHAVMRITDVFMAFPSFLLAMVMAAAMPPSLTNAAIALIVSWWPDYSRLARGSVLYTKEAAYVEAARAAGESDLRIMFRHIIPNILAPILVKATMDIGQVILYARSLSFIGLGAQPPQPEWGAMINYSRRFLIDHPWLPVGPGLFMMASVLGFNLLGDGLRDALDPRLRSLPK